MGKKLLIPAGIAVAAAAGCAAAIALWKMAPEGEVACVYQDGKEIARIPLDGSADGQTVVVQGENGEENIVEVSGKRVFMQSASCPDQLCVKAGWKDRPGSPIVCLPNKVVVTVEGEKHGTDAEVN